MTSDVVVPPYGYPGVPKQAWEYEFAGYVFMARDNSSILQVRWDTRTSCWVIHTLVRYMADVVPSPWPDGSV